MSKDDPVGEANEREHQYWRSVGGHPLLGEFDYDEEEEEEDDEE